MDNREYIELIGSYLLHKVTDRIHPFMVINKYSPYGYIKSISSEVKNREFDITPLLHFGKFDDSILRFYNILQEKLSHCNQSGFYNNLENVRIREKQKVSNIKVDLKTSGDYCSLKNRINLYLKNIALRKGNYNDQLEDVLSHELLHMATSYTKGKITLSGFSQIIGGKISACCGLNEGYTELLNKRYFSKCKKDRGSYPEQQFIALGIEEIVGREKMESLYFDADLEGLVKELSQYASIEEIHELLGTIEDCHQNDGKNDFDYKEKAAIARVMIANIKNRNDEKLYNEGKITEEDYNFRRFRSYCYIHGYGFFKGEDDYGIINRYDVRAAKMSSDAYRIVMNKFLKSDVAKRDFTVADSNNENGDLVDLCYCLHVVQFRDGYDLSDITDAEILPPKGYKLVTKNDEEVIVQNGNNDELDIMLKEKKADSSINTGKNK